MHRSRYAFAASLCTDKDVLEVACGAGTGLGYLLKKGARRVVGGDCCRHLVMMASSYYGGEPPVVRLDAQMLPFRDASFDVLLLLEAIYYLDEADCFVREAARVLRNTGQVLICTINPQWQGLIPSAHSTRYLTAHEMVELLSAHGFTCRTWGSFPTSQNSIRNRMAALIKLMPKASNFIPQTMRGKQVFKRVFLGPLAPVPNEVCDKMAPLADTWVVSDVMKARDFKVIYAVGQRAR